MLRCPACSYVLNPNAELVEWGGYMLDERTHTCNGVRFTKKLTELLSVLLRAHGRGVSREKIFASIYGEEGPVDTIIPVMIRKLRRSPLRVQIETIHYGGWAVLPIGVQGKHTHGNLPINI